MKINLLNYTDEDRLQSDSNIDGSLYDVKDGKKNFHSDNVLTDVKVYEDGRQLPGYWVLMQVEMDHDLIERDTNRRMSWDGDTGKVISSNGIDPARTYVSPMIKGAKSPFNGKSPSDTKNTTQVSPMSSQIVFPENRNEAGQYTK